MLVPNYYFKSLWNKAFFLSQGEFDLETSFSPNILVKKHLDYDKVQKVTMMLYVQVSSFDPGLISKDASFCKKKL